MAVISVPSSIPGQNYSVRITGDTPTPEEQARIDAYVAQMDARIAPPATGAATAAPEDTGPDTSFLGAIRYGLDQPLENIATTSKILGGEGIASLLSGATEAPANYQSATEGFMNEGGTFYDFSYLPRAGVEQAGQFAGSLLSRVAGAALGGAAGSVIPGVGTAGGAAAGAFAGPALFEAVQVLGPVALERARNNGRTEPNAEDFLAAAGTAAGSGALNAIAPGLSGIFKRVLVEGGTEGLQSVIQQTGETAGTDVGLQIDPRQAIGEAILGGTAAGIIDAPGAIIESRSRRRDEALKREELANTEIEEDVQEDNQKILDQIGFGKAALAGTPTVDEVKPQDEQDEKPLALPKPDGAEVTPAPGGGGSDRVMNILQKARALSLSGSNQLVSRRDVQALVDAGLIPETDATIPFVANARVRDLLDAGPDAVRQRIAPARVAPTVAPTGTQPTTETGAAPAPQRKQQPFRWRQYTSALQGVAKAGDASIPAIQRAASPDGKSLAPPAVAKAIRAQLESDGAIVKNKQAKGGFSVKPTQPTFDPAESYRRTIDDLDADISEASLAYEKATQDARRAQQTGTKADARKFALAAEKAQESIAAAQRTRQEAQVRLAQAGRDAIVPTTEAPLSPSTATTTVAPIAEVPQPAQGMAVAARSERLRKTAQYYEEKAKEQAAEVKRLREASRKVQLPKSDLERMKNLEALSKQNATMASAIVQQASRLPREIVENRAQQAASAAKEASDKAARAARAPTYTAREGELFTALRKRLDNLGLSDVKLVADRMIRPEGLPQDALVEGMMNVDPRSGNRIIALAMGIYDPKMSNQQMFDAISEVMNHEVIHALRSLGLFRNAEWKTLSDLAARQRYVRVKGGKTVERNYTYLQRAKNMYPNDTAEVQFEEAVAEMFRDYVAGRLKIGGRPRSLMERIKNFFRSIWKSHEDIGFTDANAIFEGVRFGKVGARQRPDIQPTTDAVRESRVAAERAPQDPDFQRWASGPNGERVITDADGNPRVYYTGTSKDQDFTKFKVDKHGGWFTTDPNEASSYAVENDSMGFRRDGWDMKRVNTASRVMPVFLRAANPFTGPKPESVLLQDNYKKAQTEWFDSLRRQGYDAWMPEDTPSLAVMLNDPSQVKSVFARGTDGKGDMRRFSRLIATDNPGGKWLEGKRRVAEEGMREAPPNSARGKGVSGSITAYMPNPVNFPVSRLVALSGAEDEARRPGDPRYDALAADVARRGFRSDQDGNAVVVGVNHLGDAYIIEGNTRVAVARDIGAPTIRAEVRWFNGGEAADGLFSPDAVESFVAQTDQSGSTIYPMLTVPAGTRAHGLPDILLESGDGSQPVFPVTQSYTPSNVTRNNTAISEALGSHPGLLRSESGWRSFTQDTFGGEYLPKAPFVAIGYASSPQRIAQKLRALSPALKDGVDRGFEHVQAIKALYTSGQATPDMTADLFIWGILSRGAGPVQQESAYIDVIDAARPFVERAIRGPLSDDDMAQWQTQVTGALREGSPAKQVTMNVNAAGRLLQAMSQMVPNTDSTVLEVVHEMMLDQNISGPTIRRWFLSNTESAGIDNKVVSFILLVSGRSDVLVMDRIQSRHLWDDGRFFGSNIYDGVGPDNGGLSKIMKGPRGLLVTESLENGLRDSVAEAYAIIGRPQDASLGRFHWESWVIEGEQVVDHATLAAVAARTPIGFSVTEGKMATFSSGSRYIRTENGSVMEYPLSDGGYVYMKPVTFKNFLDAIKSGRIIGEDGKPVLGADKKPIKLDAPVIPRDFKVTERADIPWYERPEVDRAALDALARRYEDAKSEGQVYGRNAGSGEGTPSSGGGRFSVRTAVDGPERGDRRGRGEVRGLAPLEGAPRVQGATGPDPRLVQVAEQYARENGIDLRRQAKYVEVDEDRARRIADEFEKMEHAPRDPKVRAAYAEVIRQTRAQYDALDRAGYKFWFIDPENPGEYASSPWNAMRDLRANQSMGVFPTIGGFGTRDVDTSDNPLLAETGLMWPYGGPDGTLVPVLANDLFRAVHDAFGHGIEGAGFRSNGEENAWQAHIRLFTGLAKGALTTETRGQNSWLNYGPFGEQNRNAKVEDTIFADQKVGLMPEWTWTEGIAPDGEAYDSEPRRSVRYAVSPISPAVGRKIQTNQKSLMYARSADLIARILGTGGIVSKDNARRFADGVLRRFQDSMLPVGRMVQELSAKGLTITDAMDPYLQEELMHGVVGKRVEENQNVLYTPVVEAVKRLNVPKSKVDQLVAITDPLSVDGKGYVSLALQQSNSPRLVLADAYLYAKHAKERNRYIKANRDKTADAGSGMSDAEADAILRWFESLDPGNKKAIQDVARGIRTILEDTNSTRVDAGLISQDVVDDNPYSYYVPLRGVTDGDSTIDEEEFTGVPGTPRYGARGREDRKALGRYGYAADIVANVFTQNQNAILRGERNKVGQSVLALMRSNPAETKAYGTVLPTAPKVRSSVNGVIKEVPNPRAYMDPDILVVKEDGKETYIRFNDDRLAGALNGKNGMSPTNGNIIIRGMQTLNRYLASINTSYNPEFVITNMARDLATANVNVNQFEIDGITKDVMKGMLPALTGIKRSILNKDDTSAWSKVYKDFVDAGGQNATNQFNTLADEMSNIQSLLGDISESGLRGQWGKVKNSFVGKGVGSLLGFIENYNTVVENGIRVATYKALLDRGFTKQRAAQAARNVTVNFAKGGDYRQFMNAWSLFYNASLQGTFAMLNAAVRSKRVQKIWLGVMFAGVLQDQLNALLSPEDEDGEKVYDKIPDYVLERNFILPDILGVTGRSYISIPMPYGLNMAHNIGRSVSRAGRGEYDPGEAAAGIAANIADTLNPIGGTESLANFFAPTVADPFIDIIENEDFADKPIYKEGLPFDRTPAPDSQQYWATTSPSAVWVAKTINELTGGNEVRPGFVDWSPDIMEFWFDFVTGGVGRFVMNTAESPITAYQEGFSEELVRNIPFVRKLVGSVSEREDMGSYIEGAKSVLMVGEELKRARETGDAEWAREVMRDNPLEVRLIGPIKSIESGLREISKKRNQITGNTSIPEEQKQLLLDRLDARKQLLLQRANQLLRQAGV